MKTIILGAGIAGLACANNLCGDVTVYEQESEPGGLCRSFRVGDFVFDYAVHLSFTDIAEVREVFDQTDYFVHQPVAYNYYHGKWIKNPVINNLMKLTADEKTRIIEAYIKRDTSLKIENYFDYLVASYGKEYAMSFSEMYTRKYWTISSRDMSTTWIGNRLASTDLNKILRGSYEESNEHGYYAREMRYPRRGGYFSFIKNLCIKPHICCNKKAIKVDVKNRIVSFSDGESVKYDRLISSIPLPKLIDILSYKSIEVMEAAKRLQYTKISLVSVGIKKPDVPKCLWFYIYDEDILASRVYSPSLKSKNNVPDGCSSLQFEIYHNNSEIVDASKIIENTKNAINVMHICDEKNILFMDYRIVDYGNVIFYKGMEEDRKVVVNFLESIGINLIGRFGTWDYLWSDQSYVSGMNEAYK